VVVVFLVESASSSQKNTDVASVVYLAIIHVLAVPNTSAMLTISRTYRPLYSLLFDDTTEGYRRLVAENSASFWVGKVFNTEPKRANFRVLEMVNIALVFGTART